MYWDRDGYRPLFECLGLARTTQHCLVRMVMTRGEVTTRLGPLRPGAAL